MKKRQRVLALFISIFLRNRSLSDARWFCGKKRKIGNGNLYLTENRLSWNVMCCASDNHNYVSHMCKRIFEFELQLRSYWQNIKFSRYCPKFPIFTNFVIFQVYLQTFETNCFIPINFMEGTGILFFHFCQLPPVKLVYSAFIFANVPSICATRRKDTKGLTTAKNGKKKYILHMSLP